LAATGPAASELLATEGEPGHGDETGNENDRRDRRAEDVDAGLAKREGAGRRTEAGGQVAPDCRNDAEDPEDDERRDTQPGSRERRACQRAAEERDRGVGHEREPLEDHRGHEPADGQWLEQDKRVEPGPGGSNRRRDTKGRRDRDDLRQEECAAARGLREDERRGPALLHRPQILFLDEPVSSLDPEGRRDLLQLIAGLRGEATVVLSTHVLSDVERICDRVAILHRGRRVTEGPLEELLAAHARPIYRLVPAPGQDALVTALVDRLRAAPWTTDVSTTAGFLRVTVSDPDAAAGAVLPLVVASGVVLESFERARPTLEDVFLELVGPAAADDLDGRGFVRPREVSDR